MEVKELGHIVLYVRDLEVSRGFYRDVLGWREIAGVEHQMAMYSTGRTHHELLLIEVGPDAAPIPAGRRVGLYHFGLKVGTAAEGLADLVRIVIVEQRDALAADLIGARDDRLGEDVHEPAEILSRRKRLELQAGPAQGVTHPLGVDVVPRGCMADT